VHYLASKPELSKAAFETGISEIEAMLAVDDNDLYRRDLFDGVTWLAQLFVETAAHSAGLEQQKRAESIARRLLQDDPDNKEKERSVAQVVSLIGDATLNLTGDASLAYEKYAEAEALARKLAASEPQRVDWQHDLYVILERRGSTQAQLGKLDEAEGAFTEAAQIVERLLKGEPENRGRQRDVSVMQERMAQFFGARAQTEPSEATRGSFATKAIQAIQRATEIRIQLLNAATSRGVAELGQGSGSSPKHDRSAI
jgi:tetratricopeptide (TPR) repeat protein